MHLFELVGFAVAWIPYGASELQAVDEPQTAEAPQAEVVPNPEDSPQVPDATKSPSITQADQAEPMRLKDWAVVISATVATVAFAASTYFNRKTMELATRRDQRDALFKAFDAYIGVRKLRSTAEHETDPSKARESWAEYYRVLFDLHWSEFYVWSEKAIADAPYEEWMKQLRQSFKDHETARNAAPRIGIHIAWDELRDRKYFDDDDEFVRHMNLVRAGQIEEAIMARNRR